MGRRTSDENHQGKHELINGQESHRMRDVMTGAAICCNGTRYNAAFLGQLQGKFQATTAPESVCLEKLCE